MNLCKARVNCQSGGSRGATYFASFGYWALLVVVGAACGFLNTLASSGSAVSLPVLMLVGLPEGVANATNRLPVLIGAVMATFTFHRKGLLDWSAAAKLAPPAMLGAIAGVILAEYMPNRDMGLLITGAMMLALLMLFTKIKKALEQQLERKPQVDFQAMALMFGVGFWLGLIVLDGATYLLLVLMLICAYSLPYANALKALLLALTTLIAIALFWSKGEIRLVEGVALSVGSLMGGYFGAKLSSHIHARQWAFRMLVIVISLELVHLGWHYSAHWRQVI